MRLAFVVHRPTDYKLFGSPIERALKRGWQVECWHDYEQPREGPKHYRFPDVAGCPRFQHGQPDVLSYSSAATLAERVGRGETDAVVSTGTAWSDTAGATLVNRPLWTCLQEGIDTFINNPVDIVDRCDLLALHSPWWAEWAASYYASTAGLADPETCRAQLDSRSDFVGRFDVDAARLVDRCEVRQRWQIPADQPVVVLLPFPQGVGRNTFWPRNVFTQPSRARRLLCVAAHGQFRYWQKAWDNANDDAVVAAVRKFCDRNGAFLLVKSRVKTPIPEYTQAVADKCVYDESFYPSTVIEALSIARVCINYYSGGVLEAAALGVPNVCVTFHAEDYAEDGVGKSYLPDFFSNKERGIFQFEGVSSTLSIEEAIADLPSRDIDDLSIDPVARQEYVRKFLGWGDGQCGERLVDMVASRVGQAAT